MNNENEPRDLRNAAGELVGIARRSCEPGASAARIFDDPHGRVAVKYAVAASPAAPESQGTPKRATGGNDVRRAFDKWHKKHRYADRENAWRGWDAAADYYLAAQVARPLPAPSGWLFENSHGERGTSLYEHPPRGVAKKEPLYTAAAVGALPVLEAQDENERLIDKLSKLLAGVAVALKGPEPARTRWSYHDLPEIAAKMAIELEIFRALPVPVVAASQPEPSRIAAALNSESVMVPSGLGREELRQFITDFAARSSQAAPAELTDEQILAIFNEQPDSISTIGFARAILAAQAAQKAPQ